ncbi:uncharacterized protein LTR77_007069 [Saxophila tyrrhenica]|uniref:Protein kinase domain-containing protein n=1 Tax=Saxophila tyrrhenica TaxID=1690608 RepID=A0AAV9P4D1_9PEZI|nr:hypothetical protein LTR77_007069 [Saxophila tyrrhenica]
MCLTREERNYIVSPCAPPSAMAKRKFRDVVSRLLSSKRRKSSAHQAAGEQANANAVVGSIKQHTPPEFKQNDNYVVLKQFEEGEEGGCSVIRSTTTSNVFVVKCAHEIAPARQTNTSQTGRRRPPPNEAKMLLRTQNHHNIIHLLDVQASTPPGRHLMYLEYCSSGDLLEQLRTFRRQNVDPPVMFTLHVLAGLSRALAFLHHGLRPTRRTRYAYRENHKPIIHGDLKPDNVFPRWPGMECGMPDVVLADFGMAAFASESRGITGTPG